MHFNQLYLFLVISVSGMTLPSDEVIYTQGDIVIKTVEDRVHYKHIYLGMDIKLALVYNRFALGLLVLDDSGFSSDVTGIVGMSVVTTSVGRGGTSAGAPNSAKFRGVAEGHPRFDKGGVAIFFFTFYALKI